MIVGACIAAWLIVAALTVAVAVMAGRDDRRSGRN